MNISRGLKPEESIRWKMMTRKSKWKEIEWQASISETNAMKRSGVGRRGKLLSKELLDLIFQNLTESMKKNSSKLKIIYIAYYASRNCM